MELKIQGAEKFRDLSAALKRVGDRELRRELYAGLNRATKSTRQKVKDNLGTALPQRGGLAAVMAGSRLSTRSRAGRNPGVRIEAKAAHDLGGMDRGRLRHPVYGRARFVTQAIEPGAFSEPIREDLPEIQQELYKSLQNVAEKFLDKH